MNIQFGSGVLIGVPSSGNLAANPTPVMFGVLQEVSVELKADLKKLYGQNQFAVATARGKIDVTIKGKMALLDPNLLNQLYFGQAQTTGMNVPTINEQHTPGVSVAVTGSGSGYVRDLGVINNSTGRNMTFVATGSPTVGQYTQSAGTYVFNASETATSVGISYSSTVTGGSTTTLSNQLMGFAPQFRCVFYNNFRNERNTLEFTNCTMGMLSLPSKQEDFWVLDFDMNANCDAGGTLGFWYADF